MFMCAFIYLLGPTPRVLISVTISNTETGLKWLFEVSIFHACAIAKVISRRIPTAAARVRSSVRSCGICGKQSGTGAGFLPVIRFPLPILIPPTAPHSSSSIIRGWYNRPNSGEHAKWIQSHPTPQNFITSNEQFPWKCRYLIGRSTDGQN
jgi:hypothetical protein